MFKREALMILPAFLLFLSVASAGNYATVYTNTTVTPGENITVWGNVYYENGTGIEGVNVTVSLANGNSSSQLTSSDGSFSANVNTTSLLGDAYAGVSTNDMAIQPKSLLFKASNIESAAIEFINTVPPFSPGSLITTKITCSGSDVSEQTVNGTIYSVDGGKPSGWGENGTVTTADGIAYLNFSIPSTASAGRYVLSFENGIASSFFMIKRYTVNVKTKDIDGADRYVYWPGDIATIEAKIADSNGDPKNVTSVVCYIIDGGGIITETNATLVSSGGYECNYTTDETSQSYNVKVTATDTIGSSVFVEESYSKFASKSVGVSLSPRTGGDFFMDFGGKKAFKVGDFIEMNIVPVNINTGEFLTLNEDYYCNGTAMHIENIWHADNAISFNSLLTEDTFNEGMYMMQGGCYYRFKIDNDLTGVFGITVNMTVGDENVIGQGYFSVQKYLLKVEPSTIFGDMDFHVMLKPLENASFKLSVFDLETNAELAIGNITSANVTKITPLSYTGQSKTELTTDDITFSYHDGSYSEGEYPYIEATLPETSGPHLLTVRAEVAGEIVTGEAFYFAKYVMGFASPSGMISGGDEQGEGGDPGGPGGDIQGGMISCQPGMTINFTAQTMDSSTMQATKGVIFNNIVEAREEETGRNILSCFSATKAISDTNGQATFNFTFNDAEGCGSFSGPYFVSFNVTYKNVTDEIEGFFMCKSFTFFPQTEPWDAQPTSQISITITNATYTTNSRVIEDGNITITRLMNMNPGSGGKVLTPATNLTADINLSGSDYKGIIGISPQDFSLERWPSGFFDGQIRVCDNDGNTCDSSFFGFDMRPYRVHTDIDQSDSYAAGDTVSFLLHAWTNVTGDGSVQTNDYNPGFDLSLREDKSMAKYSVTAFNITNKTDDEEIGGMYSWEIEEGWQIFNVTFAVPESLRKGYYMMFITVNNTDGETVSQDVFINVKSYTVGIPSKAALQFSDEENGKCMPVGDWNISMTGICLSDAQLFNNTEWDRCPGYAYNDGEWGDGLANKTGWNNTAWISTMETYGINTDISSGPEGGNQEMCGYNKLVLMSEGSNQAHALEAVDSYYSVIVFGNSTHKMMFLLHNETGDVIKLNENNAVPGTNMTLWNIEGPWYSTFANANPDVHKASEMTEDWSHAGQFQKDKEFYVPIAVFRGSSPAEGINVTIKNIYKLRLEGFGLESALPESSYNYTSAVTDSNGIAYIRLQVSESGKFKLFWKLNSTTRDAASFDKSPTFDVKTFNSYAQISDFLPEGSAPDQHMVTLYRSDAGTAYGTNYNDSQISAYDSDYYNGTHQESSQREFFVNGENSLWYFMLANATTDYANLYIGTDKTYQGDNFASVSLTASNDLCFSLDSQQTCVADWLIDNSTNTAKIIFNKESMNTEQYQLDTADQKVPIKICARNFESRGLNTTVNLTWINWMNTFGPPVYKPMAMYNITAPTQVLSAINTSSLKNNGCVYTYVRPKNDDGDVIEWPEGQSEIRGTAVNSDGEIQEMWLGQVRYWSSNTL